jgi:hypothetical protein
LVKYRHDRTHPGQAQGGGFADSSAGTGDQHCLADHRSALDPIHPLRPLVFVGTLIS